MRLAEKIKILFGSNGSKQELKDTLPRLTITKLIKLEGKERFDELTPAEVGLMIDSFLQDGNEAFDPIAFNDFLHSALTNENLKPIQETLNAKAFIPRDGNRWPDINVEFLTAYSKELQSK